MDENDPRLVFTIEIVIDRDGTSANVRGPEHTVSCETIRDACKEAQEIARCWKSKHAAH